MKRLDQFVVAQQLATSRTQAQKFIRDGRIQIQTAGTWQTQTKSSFSCLPEQVIRLLPSDDDQYVSRGGLKLAGALAHTKMVVAGYQALDIGQSTGGFTDCLLQQGAEHIVGVEVGRDQLTPAIRSDKRVSCYEGINARALAAATLLSHAPKGFDLAVMDVSFISQRLILPSLAPLLRPGGYLLSLVKPQFEVGKSGIGKGGIVRDQTLYPQVEASIKTGCEQAGLTVKDYFASSLKGGDGNREFFVWAEKAL